jgi:hypothetical protein
LPLWAKEGETTSANSGNGREGATGGRIPRARGDRNDRVKNIYSRADGGKEKKDETFDYRSCCLAYAASLVGLFLVVKFEIGKVSVCPIRAPIRPRQGAPVGNEAGRLCSPP